MRFSQLVHLSICLPNWQCLASRPVKRNDSVQQIAYVCVYISIYMPGRNGNCDRKKPDALVSMAALESCAIVLTCTYVESFLVAVSYTDRTPHNTRLDICGSRMRAVVCLHSDIHLTTRLSPRSFSRIWQSSRSSPLAVEAIYTQTLTVSQTLCNKSRHGMFTLCLLYRQGW